MYKSDKNRERKNYINLYLSDREKLILETKLKESGLHSISDFIRHLIVNGDVFVIDFSDVREMNHLLGKIGNNINQIAHKVNTFGAADRTDIDAIKEAMDEIWRSQKSILSKLQSAEQSTML